MNIGKKSVIGIVNNPEITGSITSIASFERVMRYPARMPTTSAMENALAIVVSAHAVTATAAVAMNLLNRYESFFIFYLPKIECVFS